MSKNTAKKHKNYKHMFYSIKKYLPLTPDSYLGQND